MSVFGQIETVTIPTSGRPTALLRCLESLSENLIYYCHSPNILIVDGSVDRDVIEANKRHVDTLKKNSPCQILMVNYAGRREILNNLIRAGIEKDVANFAINGLNIHGLSTVGANRNVAILSSAGNSFLSIDDDVVLDFWVSAQPYSTFAVREKMASIVREDLGEIVVFPDQTPTGYATAKLQVDVLNSHAVVLGRTLSELAGRSCSTNDKSILEPLPDSNDKRRVRITLNGLIGDCGWGSPSQYLFIDDSSYKRLTTDHEVYSKSVQSRNLLQSFTLPTITVRADSLMTSVFGADARSLLPPFVPVGRGSDVIFAQCLKKIDPSAYFAHLPWAVLHMPVEKRQFWPGEIIRSASSSDIKSMFCGLIEGFKVASDSQSDDRCRAFGRYLTGLAELNQKCFHETIANCKRVRTIEEIEVLEVRRRAIPSQSIAPRTDLDAYIRSLKKSCNSDLACIPGELLYKMDMDDAIKMARTIVGIFGRLLVAWPDMLKIVPDLARRH
jgi:hypothetical protein